MTRRNLGAGGAAIVLAGAATCLVYAAQNVNENVQTPAALIMSGTVDACDNSGGPTITLQGDLLFGEINARLIFQNNMKGTHQNHHPVTVDVNLLSGDTISFAKQPPQGGVGGNPWIFIEFFDESWESISDRMLMGRCVQGLHPVDFDFLSNVGVDMVVSGSCSNNPGPHITLEGELTLGGVNAVLSFQNSMNNPPHQHDEVVDVEFEILEQGETIEFAKQPPLGGVGGNPHIFLQFLDEDDMPIGQKIYLGRCNKLN